MIGLLAGLMMAAAPLTAQSKEFGNSWASLSLGQNQRYESVDVDIGTLALDDDTDTFVYWLRLSVVPRDKSRPSQVAWTDTRSCSSAKGVITRLREFPLGAVTTPDQRREAPILVGGMRYRLRAPAVDGEALAEIELTSRDGNSRLAAFIDESFNALSDCWTEQVPQK